MSKQIWKFRIDNPDETTIEMPKDAKILTVQVQRGIPCIWALVDTEYSNEKRFFEIFGTGHDVKIDIGIQRQYIGTFQIHDNLVFHLFERIN